MTDELERKLRRMPQRWRDLLETPGGEAYDDDESRADMGLIDALVKFRFSDQEIWALLEGSPRLIDRIQRKGEKHARALYAHEIEKARDLVVPFSDDPAPPPTRRPAAVVAPRGSHGPSLNGHAVLSPQTEPWTPSTSADSFVTKYVAYASQRTDAPPEAHELMAVGVLSALAGPSPRLPVAVAVFGWRLALWVMYLVNSTVGRKSTVLSLARDVLVAVLGEPAVIEWEGSPQGFIQRLQDRDGKSAVFMRDEYSGLMEQVNRGGHLAGMPQTLIRAYDGGVIENVRVRKRNKLGEMAADTDRVNDPYLTTIAASTYDPFTEAATVQHVRNGFLARFIFVSGHAEPRPLKLATAALLAQRDQIIEHARYVHDRANLIGELDVPPAVLAAHWEIEQAWVGEARQYRHADAVAASMQRMAGNVLKVAALLAIDESDVPRVALPHFDAARAMGERWWKPSTLMVLDDLGQTEFRRNCDEIRDTVLAHPGGITLADLYTRNRDLKKRDFDEALAALTTQEVIEMLEVRTGKPGRPPAVVFPYGARSDAVTEEDG